MVNHILVASLMVVAFALTLAPSLAPKAEAYTNYGFGTTYTWGGYSSSPISVVKEPEPVTSTTLVCPRGQYVLKNVWGQFLCAPYSIRYSYNYGKLYYPYTKVTYTSTGSFTLGYR